MFELLAQATRPVEVACLACGVLRITGRTATGHLGSPECLHCGYLGWSEPSSNRFVNVFAEWRLPEPSLGSTTV